MCFSVWLLAVLRESSYSCHLENFTTYGTCFGIKTLDFYHFKPKSMSLAKIGRKKIILWL